MSWLYLPELVADYSQASGCLDGGLSATLKTQPIPSKYSKLEYATDYWMTLQSGTTLEHSTGDPGVDVWILSLRDSRASHLALRENAREKTTNEICGLTPFVLLEKSHQNGAYWKTSQGCLPGLTDTLERYSESWPKAGMMLDGVCYLRRKWERRIKEIGSGLWRTPNSQLIDAKTSVSKLEGRTPQDPQVGLADQVMAAERQMWPTPRSNPSTETIEAITARDARNYGRRKSGLNLSAAVRMWPTPRQFMHKDAITDRGQSNLGEVVGGKLNPTWVEWLMGWPLGWTDLKPLGMDKFQSWLKSFGNYWSDR